MHGGCIIEDWFGFLVIGPAGDLYGQDVSSVDSATHLNIQLLRTKTGLPDRERLNIFPNPFINRSLISYTAGLPGRYRLRLYDLKGRLVFSEGLTHEMEGNYSYRLDASGLDQGIYILQFVSPASTITRKIYKIR